MGSPSLASKFQPQPGLLPELSKSLKKWWLPKDQISASGPDLIFGNTRIQSPRTSQLLVCSLSPQSPISHVSSATGTSAGPEGSLLQTRFKWALAE